MGFFWYQKGHPGHLPSELDPFIKGPAGWRGWLWMTGRYWRFTSGGSPPMFFWERQWQWSIFSGRKNNFSRFFEKDPFLKIKSMNFGWLSQWIRNGDFIILNFGNYFQFMIKSPFLSMVALATNEDSSTLRFFFVSDFSRGIPCRWPWRNRLFPIIFR